MNHDHDGFLPSNFPSIDIPIYILCSLVQCYNEIFNTKYSFGGRKFEHALKHGAKNGLFVVTLGWFVDSVRKNGN